MNRVDALRPVKGHSGKSEMDGLIFGQLRTIVKPGPAAASLTIAAERATFAPLLEQNPGRGGKRMVTSYLTKDVAPSVGSAISAGCVKMKRVFHKWFPRLRASTPALCDLALDVFVRGRVVSSVTSWSEKTAEARLFALQKHSV